jgi:glycosyltransferase involved in cell wall biosynthesis
MADADATIFAFPKAGISYNDSLYAAVEQLGATVREGVWSGSWLLREMRAGDVMHLHWPSFQYYDARSSWRTLVGFLRFVTLLSILRARGVRIVWTAHNLYPHDGGRGLWVHRFARRFVIRLAEVVFVHGPSARRLVQREFSVPVHKLREIPHGHWIGYYPDALTRAAARSKLGIDTATYVYAFVGTCKPYKNLDQLLRAFARQANDAQLLVVGNFQSPVYLAQIRQLIAELGTDRVRLEPRFIDDSEMQVYLKASDAIVLPYREILTSGSAMLAFGFGRPVVVPRLGALIDVVDESCGVLYDADDPEGLPQALAAIRRTTYDEARIKRHAEGFRWADSAAELVAVARSGDR